MNYNWESFKKECAKLYNIIDYPFTHIVAIERGGVYVGEEIIKYRKVPFKTIKISTYNGKDKRKYPIINVKNLSFKVTDKVLLVDELIEHGDTINIAQNVLKECGCNDYKIAVLIDKPHSKIKADYSIHKDISCWCYFPWEENN